MLAQRFHAIRRPGRQLVGNDLLSFRTTRRRTAVGLPTVSQTKIPSNQAPRTARTRYFSRTSVAPKPNFSLRASSKNLMSLLRLSWR